MSYTIPNPKYPRISVNPKVCVGQPVIHGTRIPTEVVYDMWLSGNSAYQLAHIYDVTFAAMWDAINYEHDLAKKDKGAATQPNVAEALRPSAEMC
jgi:uncharacterized protein (DUF433 family)